MATDGSLADKATIWPALPLQEWQDTYATLHMWTQIVGKIRLVQSPMINHWWQVPFYVTTRGLTTSPIPYGEQSFEIDFDFIDHQLLIRTNRGVTKNIGLRPCAVADFYHELMSTLEALGFHLKIYTTPVEIPDPIPFEKDYQHASYDAEYAHRCWRILVQSDKVFKEFRGRFIGKCSPVHFFWGSFDLAVSRFSGRRAPARPDADAMTREGYSHEVISCGFWPGSGAIQAPAFYAYAAPVPPGLDKAAIRPSQAFFSPEMFEFILLYDDMRQADDPHATLMEFLQSTYEAGANLAHWDRQELERG